MVETVTDAINVIVALVQKTAEEHPEADPDPVTDIGNLVELVAVAALEDTVVEVTEVATKVSNTLAVAEISINLLLNQAPVTEKILVEDVADLAAAETS